MLQGDVHGNITIMQPVSTCVRVCVCVLCVCDRMCVFVNELCVHIFYCMCSL